MTHESRKRAIASTFEPIDILASIPTEAQEPKTGTLREAMLLAAVARAEYSGRRRCERIFDEHIFAEPAWDMLLNLYIQGQQAQPVSIRALRIAAAVPQTTAVRWIRRLDSLKYIKRSPSPDDNRVIHVTLSDRGQKLIERYLREQLGDVEAIARVNSWVTPKRSRPFRYR
jgi:DNA-binding MarR family transcriptional regulator